ncbi:hypothetical protein LI954_14145 [Enterococcus sp. CWB-B31]|nr:hypothetical protein [Enterococcus sp. CWB-B31]
MGAVKSVFTKLYPGIPFVLVNTMPFIPYLVFLNMHTGAGWEGILPFVLFYTVRIAGIFLLKSFRLALTTLHIFILSLIVGALGGVFGILGEWWYPCYLLSAVLIGLSAAWLPPTNTTIKYQRKELKVKKEKTSSMTLVFMIVLIGIFIGSLTANFPARNLVIFTEYTLLYLAALFKMNSYPVQDRRMDKMDEQTFFMKEFLLFLVYFILLIIVRLARTLFDSHYLSIAVIGFSACLIVASWYISTVHRNWKLPIWLNLLVFINGMSINFILLFGTFYTAFYFGNNKIALYLYTPYILGILASKLLMKYIYHLFLKLDRELIHIFGLIFSLILLMFRAIFPIGVFIFSMFISAASTYLNQVYAESSELPKDQRIIIRYAAQSKGSIVHQFLIMGGLWIMAKGSGISINTILQITGYREGNPQILHIIDAIHYLSIGILLYLLFFILYERLFKNRKLTIEK